MQFRFQICPKCFTPLEQRVFLAMVEHVKIEAVAAALHTTVRNVKFSLEQIYLKMDLHSFTEILAYLLQLPRQTMTMHARVWVYKQKKICIGAMRKDATMPDRRKKEVRELLGLPPHKRQKSPIPERVRRREAQRRHYYAHYERVKEEKRERSKKRYWAKKQAQQNDQAAPPIVECLDTLRSEPCNGTQECASIS